MPSSSGQPQRTRYGPARGQLVGLTLLELIVAGALFAIFTGMVAQAMVMGHRAQRTVSSKLDSVRHASLALDLLMRDLQSAPSSAFVQLNAVPVPATLTRPTPAQELRITRFRAAGLPSSVPTEVTAGYWLDDSTGEEGEWTVRRILYDDAGSPLPGEYSGGKIIVRDVREFEVMATAIAGGLMVRAGP